MAIVYSRFGELLRPGMLAYLERIRETWERAYLTALWAEEIQTRDRKVTAEVLEEAIEKLEKINAHPTSA